MRWRLAVLGLLSVALGVGFVLCTLSTAEMSYRGQQVFNNSQQQQPSPAQQADADRLFRQSSALDLALTPLAIGSLVCALAIPAVLGRRWQVREAD
ncbi:MAG: hypothetical protein ABIO06_11670 [Pseudolysinimonas sp.]